MQEDELTTTEAALIYNCHPSYFRHEIKNGRLTAQKRGRDWFIKRADFDEFRNREKHHQFKK